MQEPLKMLISEKLILCYHHSETCGCIINDIYMGLAVNLMHTHAERERECKRLSGACVLSHCTELAMCPSWH